MSKFSRKVARTQVKIAGSELEMQCDLLESWFRKNPERGLPPAAMLGWISRVLRNGKLPGNPDNWPLLFQFLTTLDNYRLSLVADDKFSVHLAISHVLATALAAEVWLDAGCPRVRCEDQVSAALMLTDSSKAELRDELPWQSFLISVPKETLRYRYKTDEGHVEDSFAESVLVSQSGDVFMVHLIGAEPSIPFCIAWDKTLSGLLSARDSWQNHAVAADMAVNLVRGVLLQIQSGNMRQETVRARSGAHSWRRPGDLPETTDYVLGTSVSLRQDYVAAVKRIARGEVRYGKVQWMVRGHQRWQACGLRHQDRKLIWVPPHWKGPVDAPILQRDHVLNEDKL